MSRILFLIGNGFDRNIGLETEFSHVKNEYLIRKSTDPIINEFKKVLESDYENWSDFEIAMGEYTETGKFNSSTKDFYLYQINSFLDVLISKFEKEEARINYDSDKICGVFKNSLTDFIKYLSPESRDAISSYVSISQTNKEFYYDFITFNYTNILDKCIKIVKKNMGNGFGRSYVNQYGQHNVKDTIGKVLHIHGTLQRYPILGVDNPDQIANKELARDEKFQWEVIKTRKNEELGENYHINAKEMIDKSSIICFFGISIGETDKTWWRHIFNWLKENISRHLIIFYYNKKKTEKDGSAYINHKHEVKDKFFGIVGSTNEERETLENRVHIAQENGDMFKLDILGSVNDKKSRSNFLKDFNIATKEFAKIISSKAAVNLKDLSELSKKIRDRKRINA